MGCRCGQRRQLIVEATKAAVTGDLKAASANMAEVNRTMREDAASGLRVAAQRLAAAHARLRR